MAKAYIVIRHAVLQEDEGHQHHIAVYTDGAAAKKWVADQKGQYFPPSDYWIAEVDLIESR